MIIKNFTISLCLISSLMVAGQKAVNWTDQVGVSVVGNDLVRTATGAVWNAGAASSSYLWSGVSGWVECVVKSSSKYRMIGFSAVNSNENYTSISFAVYIRADRLRVYENGVNKGDFTSNQVGDVVRVERVDDVVQYKKNGIIFYQSTVGSTTDVLVDASIHSGTLSDVQISKSFSAIWGVVGEDVYREQGNVGIGTATPSEKLTVEGKISSTGDLIANGLTIGKYGAALSGDADPWKINSPNGSGNHDLIVFGKGGGSGGASLNMRLYDGSLKVGPDVSPNAELYNDGSGYFNGSVGIGTTTPDEKLTVKGKIHTEEVRVDLSVPAPDYVFADNYNLPTLESIEKFIKSESHLPEIPSAKEMEANGVELGTMNMLLLKKIEELTLYTLSQQKQLDLQQKLIIELLEDKK